MSVLRNGKFLILIQIGACLLSLGADGLAGQREKDPQTVPSVEFNRDIRPILSDACFQCHGPDQSQRKADLRLDTEDGVRSMIDVDDLPVSELLRRIVSDDADERMPPDNSGKKLTTDQIELVRRWIVQGAEWQRHWSFVPATRPALPPFQPFRDKRWPRNAIDCFILARLQREGRQPSSQADKQTLIRRVTLDLTGLPPTLREIDLFVADDNPDAYEKLVDRLLGSARYGERMALDWLDAARYSDTFGYHQDYHRDMWLWRQWVIDALNANMPFDQFTVQQLAGDMLPNPTRQQLIATGFNRLHGVTSSGLEGEFRVKYVSDRIETTATVWLGLTLGCARCHDHKFDAISQAEFYRFFAVFNDVDDPAIMGDSGGNLMPWMRLPTPRQEVELAMLEKQTEELRGKLEDRAAEIDQLPEDWETKLEEGELEGDDANEIMRILAIPPTERSNKQQAKLRRHYIENHDETSKALKAKLDEVQKMMNQLAESIPTTMVMRRMRTLRDSFLLHRGDYQQPGTKVTPGTPASLPPLPDNREANRLTVAKWLVDPTHPLTARVTVNRLWQLPFGVGIVKTSEDFGSQGEMPSHPKLLDWMATEFTSNEWNIKSMLRLMVTSATYRQSSSVANEMLEYDPDNRLLARGPRHRLPAEIVRDNALSISGLLVERLGGRSVKPYQPEGLWIEQSTRAYQQDHGADLYRRGIYTYWRRSIPPVNMLAFDAPSRNTCTVRRQRTNTPLMALVTLNDPTFVEAARAMAERIMKQAGASDQERVDFAFQLATARRPTVAERSILMRVLDGELARYRKDPRAAQQLLEVGESPRNEQSNPADHAAWTTVCRLILNLDETITKG